MVSQTGPFRTRLLIGPSACLLGTKPRFVPDDDVGLVSRERAERCEEALRIRLWDGLRLARHRLGSTPGPELTRALVREMAAVAQSNDARLVMLTWNQRNAWGNEATMDWEDPKTAWPANLSFVDTLTDAPPAWDDWVIAGATDTLTRGRMPTWRRP